MMTEEILLIIAKLFIAGVWLLVQSNRKCLLCCFRSKRYSVRGGVKFNLAGVKV